MNVLQNTSQQTKKKARTKIVKEDPPASIVRRSKASNGVPDNFLILLIFRTTFVCVEQTLLFSRLIPQERKQKTICTMKINLHASVLVALWTAASLPEYEAFIPSSIMRSRPSGGQVSTSPHAPQGITKSFLIKNRPPASQSSTTRLFFSQELFDESKYTEAAWSSISSLTSAADYYQATTLEAPLLLDLLLNPSKHGTGGDEGANAAKRVVEKALANAGVDVKVLRSGLESYMSKQPRVTGATGQKTMGRTLQKVLETARDGTSALGDSFVSVESLLLALCKEDDLYTRDALLKQDVKYMDIMKVVKESRDKSGPVQSRGAETNYDALNKYGIDFTEQAREGKLDPVIGRDDEIRRAIQILSRRTKNNPVLIGDPGVGKVSCHDKYHPPKFGSALFFDMGYSHYM